MLAPDHATLRDSDVTSAQQTQEMFNLTVDEAHTFYVGTQKPHGLGVFPTSTSSQTVMLVSQFQRDLDFATQRPCKFAEGRQFCPFQVAMFDS